MISAFATTASTIVPRNPQSVVCEVQLHLLEQRPGPCQDSDHLTCCAAASLNSFLSLLLSLSKLRLRYQGHTEPNAETTSHTAPQRVVSGKFCKSR
jgi:hypothetical protein